MLSWKRETYISEVQIKPGTVKTNRFEYKSSYRQAVEKDRKFERKENYRRID